MIRLNLGCGESKLEDFVNIDMVKTNDVMPDLVLDVRKERFPYEDESVDDVWMLHSIEHIERYYWNHLFQEVYRVLKPNGVFLLSYPEFGECAKRFIENKDNNRIFYSHTLYGRQLWDSDYHVVPMHSSWLKEQLEPYGFYRIYYQPESEQEPYNTVFVARRDPEISLREDVITKELNLLPAAQTTMVESLVKNGLIEEYEPKTYRVTAKGKEFYKKGAVG